MSEQNLDNNASGDQGGSSNINVEELQAQLRAKMEQEFEAEKTKILQNRDEILAEKKALQEKFKDVDVDQLEKFRQLQAEAQKNELARLASEGRIDELKDQLMQSQRAAWDETKSEYEARLEATSSKVQEYETKLQELQTENVNMRKHQYLKDLTSTDDTFKGEYFSHFVKLYSDQMGIDESTGEVFALDKFGKKMVDANGDFETFETFYNRQKVKDGLFWNGAQGSGHMDGGSGDGSIPISKMTLAQKAELKKEIGEAEFAKRLSAGK